MKSNAAGQRPAQAIDPRDWDGAIATVPTSTLVVGGPGTGKTEFLVRRAVHLLESSRVPPENVTILGFSRRGVAEVRNRIRRSLPGSVGGLDVATFHSYAARLLELDPTGAGWAENPQILTGPEQVAMVHRLLSTEEPADWSPAFGRLLGTQTFAREVTDFILRSAEQMHSSDTLAEMGRADWRGLPRFVARYQDALRADGRVDYGSLIASAVALVQTQETPADSQTPRFVLVDEYQDTTTAQVRLLQALHRQGAQVLAAADPYQSIYSFRGASLQNVASFEDDFGSAVAPAVRLLLTTSFRTPATILETAVGVTTGDLPGATGAVIPASGSGVVETYLFDQQVEEAEWIAAEAKRLHLVEHIPYDRIGVFVRSKRRLLADLSRALERRHIPHELPGTRLSDQPAVRFVLDLAAAAAGCDGPAGTNQAIRRVLLGKRVGLTIGAFRLLERRAAAAGAWVAAIREQLPGWSALAGLLDDPTWANQEPAIQGLWRVWNEFPGIEAIVADPAAAEERAAWRSLAQVLTRWGERNPTGTLLDYRSLASNEDFEAQPLLSYRRPSGDRLTLTTLHQAKGLDLDVVFIADAVDGVFPDLRTRDSLLGVRHLLPYVPTDNAEYRTFRLQEESRLAYTAMTRARRRVVWTATERGLDDGPGRPSRFLAKVARLHGIEPGRPLGEVSIAPVAPAGTRRPVTGGEAEAALRRLLSDAANPTPARLAALSLLSDGKRWNMRHPHLFSGVLQRGPDRGIVSGADTLSPSQAQSYEQCPRRYVLERRLKVGSDSSIYATFGTLIHDVLEAAERSAIESGRDHSDLDDALAELVARFDPNEFGGSPYAESWALRAERGLEKLYSNWPAPGRTAAFVEHHLDTVIDGVRWTGRADRIDLAGTELTIVDYKTSKQPAIIAEAATSLQLGFYVLAAARDVVVAAAGAVSGAEFWYPMSTAKGVTTREFDMSQLDAVEARLTAIAAGIGDEDWSPIAGSHCDRCALRTMCPVWAEGGPEFA
ncbi:MAG: ATP-dependent DNA helicase [Acidimicrobiia bacterium]|nr:ATP-dependent DNA helicase [Acidimicrobiia bacterium]